MVSPHFMKFCCIGGAGFLADTGALLALVHLGMAPMVAKVLSFALAVVLTFEGNRLWAFGSASRGGWLPTFAAYLGVQGTGFVVNWLIFGLCLGLLPSGRLSLVAAIVLAAIGGLLVNFLGARRLVFRAGFDCAVARTRNRQR